MHTVFAMRLPVIGALPAAAQFSGSIQTTLPDGSIVNGNIYPSRGEVFLTARPKIRRLVDYPMTYTISRLPIRPDPLCYRTTLSHVDRSLSAVAGLLAPTIMLHNL
jgi:hypothetical protein